MKFIKNICKTKTGLAMFSDGVKVNMQGSLSLGKDVVDTISYFIRKNNLSGRRTFREHNDPSKDIITLIVNSALLCRDIDFCQGDTNIFLDDYIITIAKTIEGIFEGLLEDHNKDNGEKLVIFEEELRFLITDIKILLRNANDKENRESQSYKWLIIIKKINAKFQDRAMKFATQRLVGTTQEINEVKKKLTEQLISALSMVELKFELLLCSEHNICSKSYECTKSLDTILEQLKTLPDERAKQFVRYFYEALPNTAFYRKISDVSANEFQAILNDMAYAQNIPTKNVLMIVHKSVQDRLNAVTQNIDKESGRDVKLLHVILSDMDNFYSKQRREPFQDFLSKFFEWSSKGGRFLAPLRRVMIDIQDILSFEPNELITKLTNEVKVFMEITVDPQK